MKTFLAIALACWTWTCSAVVPFALGLGFDAEVNDWNYHVTLNAGSAKIWTRLVLTDLLRDYNVGQVRTPTRRLNPYKGTGLGACRTPLIHDTGDGFDTLVNFVEADYSETNGLTGDASTKYNNTQTSYIDLFAVDSVNHSISYGLFNRSASNAAEHSMGSHDGSSYSYLSPSIAAVSYFAMANPGLQMTAVDSAGTGFYLGTRTTDTDRKLYKNGTQIASNAVADNGAMSGGGSANTNRLVFVHCFANWTTTPPTPTALTSRTLAGYQFATGLDATQQGIVNNAWQKMETNIVPPP